MMDGLYPAAGGAHYRSSWEAMRRCGPSAAAFGLEENLLVRAANLVDNGGDIKPGAMPVPFLRHHHDSLQYAAGFDAQGRPAHLQQMQSLPQQQHSNSLQQQQQQQQQLLQHQQQLHHHQQQHQHHQLQHQQQQQHALYMQDMHHSAGFESHLQAMGAVAGYAYPASAAYAASVNPSASAVNSGGQMGLIGGSGGGSGSGGGGGGAESHCSVSPGHSYAMPLMPPPSIGDLDYDPRELEAFAERFKQRRIKLGVTQADVGKALGNLKLPGVGSLSQSTICRFESLTLSHNNMIALKPVLQAWLEEAEHVAMERQKNPDVYGDGLDKKRKRTSITDAEKRSLEAYFHVQPRPSSEKIAQIAEKLNLKKNVVRVWFCNQRQKQKRMKFASPGMHPSPH